MCVREKRTDNLPKGKNVMKKYSAAVAVLAAVFVCFISCAKKNDGKTTVFDDVLTSVKDEAESVGEKASEKLSEGAGKAKDAAEDGASKVGEKLSEGASKVKDAAEDGASKIGEKLTTD